MKGEKKGGKEERKNGKGIPASNVSFSPVFLSSPSSFL